MTVGGTSSLLSPLNIGVVGLHPESEIELEPRIVGSGSVAGVETGGYRLLGFPEMFEASGGDVAAIVGLVASIEYLQGLGESSIVAHVERLSKAAIEGLASIDRVKLIGADLDRLGIDPRYSGIIGFYLEGFNAHDASIYLDEASRMAIRSGVMCSQPIFDKLGIRTGLQVSFHVYNSLNDVDLLVSKLSELSSMLD